MDILLRSLDLQVMLARNFSISKYASSHIDYYAFPTTNAWISEPALTLHPQQIPVEITVGCHASPTLRSTSKL